MSDVSRETAQPVPEIVGSRYPDALPRLIALHDWLADAGVERGLIGPREIPRLWDRHVLNCAVVAELIPESADTLLDVGSGAGLPGLVLALVRPDISVTLLEPLERRSLFLQESVALLALEDQVRVVRGRAEDVREKFDVVTARAVAPMGRLAGWCLPLVAPGGRLLAMKGAKAPEEAAEASAAFPRWSFEVRGCGAGVVSPETTVVVATMGGSAR